MILIYIRKGVHDDVELMIHMICPDDVEGFEMHGFSKGKAFFSFPRSSPNRLPMQPHQMMALHRGPCSKKSWTRTMLEERCRIDGVLHENPLEFDVNFQMKFPDLW